MWFILCYIILCIRKMLHGNTIGTQSRFAFNSIFLNLIFGEYNSSSKRLNQLFSCLLFATYRFFSLILPTNASHMRISKASIILDSILWAYFWLLIHCTVIMVTFTQESSFSQCWNRNPKQVFLNLDSSASALWLCLSYTLCSAERRVFPLLHTGATGNIFITARI